MNVLDARVGPDELPPALAEATKFTDRVRVTLAGFRPNGSGECVVPRQLERRDELFLHFPLIEFFPDLALSLFERDSEQVRGVRDRLSLENRLENGVGHSSHCRERGKPLSSIGALGVVGS
jgi:hypothetical protein